MIDVACDVCLLKMRVNYVPKGGEKILLKCKGKSCDNNIELTFPVAEQVSDPTITIGANKLSSHTPVIQLDYNDTQMSYPLMKGINVIGRKDYDKHPDISLNVDDSSMSRLHCMVEGIIDKKKRQHFIIQDYKSVNGVYLNGKKLSKYDQVYLDHNDEIYLSKTKITFKSHVN